MTDRSASGPTLTSVALPREHGGWSLTLEPALLGLIVAPTWAGAALAAMALVGFLARTPLKTAMVDRRRRRHLPRTVLATRVVAVETVAIAVLVAFAATTAEAGFWMPLLFALPLLGIELWYDVRSRSRRLVPELAGTVGIASVAAAIALAGAVDTPIAYGLWAVAAARAVAAVVFVRVQLRRAKDQPHRLATSDAGQAVAIAAIATTTAAEATSGAALAAIAILAAIHIALVRRPPPAAPVLGAQQVVLGLAVIVVAGLAAAAP